MEPSRGHGSGIGLLGFAILAIVLVVIVATVAYGLGHQVANAEQAIRSMP